MTLPELSRYEVVAFDLETKDDTIKTLGPGWCFPDAGFIAGVAVAYGDQQQYFGVQHEHGPNVDPDQFHRWAVNELLNNPNSVRVAHNAIYDIGWLEAEVGSSYMGPVVDTMFMAALLDENRRSYSLDNVGADLLGERKAEDALKEKCLQFAGAKENNWKSFLWRLPASDVEEYAAQDAGMTLRLYKHMAPQIKEEGLEDLLALECRLLLMTIAMRQEGLLVDLDRAQRVADTWLAREQEIARDLNAHLGFDVDVWSPKSLQRTCEDIGVAHRYTAKGNPSFPKEWMRSHEHPVIQLIAEQRRLNKSRRDYIQTNILENSVNGRVHAETNLLKSDTGDGSTKGTVSGRLSVTNPPLQQQPSPDRDPVIGPEVRSLFLPEHGCRWGSADYSQQEPRLIVHYAYLLGLKGAEHAVEQYNENPRTDYHQMVADMAGIQRRQAKMINLALAYVMGPPKLCRDLGLPVVYDEEKGREVAGPEGQALFKKYHAEVPFIRLLTDRCSTIASRRGYIRTLLNRRCRFPLCEPTGWSSVKRLPLTRPEAEEKWPGKALKRGFTYKAMNRLIQGGAADQTKTAMDIMWREGIMPKIQMHDEINISYDDEKDFERTIEIMIHAIELAVPTVIDAETGPNWGECEEWRS